MSKFLYLIGLVLLISGVQRSFASVVDDKFEIPSPMRQYCLSSAQLESYVKNGFLVVTNFFSQGEIQEVVSSTKRLQSEAEKLSKKLSKRQTEKVLHRGTQFVIDRPINPGDPVVIHRLTWACGMEPGLRTLARQPKLLVPISQLLESRQADHLICQVHPKISGDMVAFGWHQDVQNRRIFDPDWEDIKGNGSFVQTLVAIDDMDEGNGGLMYVPNDRLGALGLEAFKELYLDAPKKIASLSDRLAAAAIPIQMKAGDILFMNPYLVHGSCPNTSERRRILFINGFSYPGANKKPYPGEGSAKKISLTHII
jgi:ectoine hydroxylase-related dioxygenase (phytanoyl-CoA dioxygenase family)